MPDLQQRPEGWEVLAVTQKADAAFASWVARNVTPHKHPDYAVVTISLKPIGGIPGDASAEQMELVADIAETYSFDEIRAE
jgi:sulfite reductase (NADPH) hemoprotein beta-component